MQWELVVLNSNIWPFLENKRQFPSTSIWGISKSLFSTSSGADQEINPRKLSWSRKGEQADLGVLHTVKFSFTKHRQLFWLFIWSSQWKLLLLQKRSAGLADLLKIKLGNSTSIQFNALCFAHKVVQIKFTYSVGNLPFEKSNKIYETRTNLVQKLNRSPFSENTMQKQNTKMMNTIQCLSNLMETKAKRITRNQREYKRYLPVSPVQPLGNQIAGNQRAKPAMITHSMAISSSSWKGSW